MGQKKETKKALTNMAEQVKNQKTVAMPAIGGKERSIKLFPSPNSYRTLRERVDWGENNQAWKMIKVTLQCFSYPISEGIAPYDYNHYHFKDEWYEMCLQTMESAMQHDDFIRKGETLLLPTGMWDYKSQAFTYVKLVKAQESSKPWKAVGAFPYFE